MTEFDPVKGDQTPNPAIHRHPMRRCPSRSTRVAHALGPRFGIVGAIVVNVISLFYFASLYASG